MIIKKYILKYLNGFSDNECFDFLSLKKYKGNKESLNMIRFRVSFLVELKKNQSINAFMGHVDNELFYRGQIPYFKDLKKLVKINSGELKNMAINAKRAVQRSEVCLPSTSYLRKVLHFPFIQLHYGFEVKFPKNLNIYHIFEFVTKLQEFYCQNISNHHYIFIEKINKKNFRLFFVILAQPHPYKLLPLEHMCELHFNFLIFLTD